MRQLITRVKEQGKESRSLCDHVKMRRAHTTQVDHRRPTTLQRVTRMVGHSLKVLPQLALLDIMGIPATPRGIIK